MYDNFSYMRCSDVAEKWYHFKISLNMQHPVAISLSFKNWERYFNTIHVLQPERRRF